MYSVNPIESFCLVKIYQRRCPAFSLDGFVLFVIQQDTFSFEKVERICCLLSAISILVYNSPHGFNTRFKKLASAIEDSNGFTEYTRVPHIKFIELFNVISPFTQNKDIQNFKYECLFSLVRFCRRVRRTKLNQFGICATCCDGKQIFYKSR